MIQATVWAGIYKSFGFELEEGMKINVIGRIQLYEPSGELFHCHRKGGARWGRALAIQFEQLKKKLTEEGLFQDRWKQALPQFPRKIGVVTSQKWRRDSRYYHNGEPSFSWCGHRALPDQGSG